MIETQLYEKITEVLPIVCVDGFIIKNFEILLLKRKKYPAINEWWVPGGRVLKNEILTDSILRKVKEETGLTVKIIKQIGVTETIFEKKHTINICYLLELKEGNVRIDSDHSEYNWFALDKLPENFNNELNIILQQIK